MSAPRERSGTQCGGSARTPETTCRYTIFSISDYIKEHVEHAMDLSSLPVARFPAAQQAVCEVSKHR